MTELNWFDLVIIGILVLSAIVSIFRGLIKEVLSLLIWVAAFWLAWTFVEPTAELFNPYIDLPSARHLIAFVALFLSALIVGGLINYLLGGLIKKTGLGATDRFFGMFFGLLRGAVAVTALVFFLKATPLSQDPWWQGSKLQPHFSKLADWAKQRMPDELSGYFNFLSPENKSATPTETGVKTEPEQPDKKALDKQPQTPEAEPSESQQPSTDDRQTVSNNQQPTKGNN